MVELISKQMSYFRQKRAATKGKDNTGKYWVPFLCHEKKKKSQKIKYCKWLHSWETTNSKKADIMTRQNLIYGKALSSSNFSVLLMKVVNNQVPVVRLSNYIKVITQVIFPQYFPRHTIKQIDDE